MKKILLKGILLGLALTGGNILRAQSKIEDESIAPLVNGVPEKSIRGDIVPDSLGEFPGGTNALNKFLGEHSEDIDLALRKTGIKKGTVVALLLVDDEGNISEISIIEHLNQEVDQAVINTLAKMPRWKPAEYHGKKITYFHKLPLDFQQR